LRPSWDRTVVGLGVGFGIAVGLSVVLAALAIGLGTLTDDEGFFVLGIGILLIGVAQLVVDVPLFVWAMRRRASHFARGLIIAAGVVFLVNAGCWGLVATTGFQVGG